ncbi:CD82 antigen [Fundulus heteroclitus]|uniref:CD82 antigen n=1 Tax=Fundulus heteroclitus TaxID=8078 RepID=UPI00165CC6C6|nr:CD82 antigen [Fundulus heteroclitus]
MKLEVKIELLKFGFVVLNSIFLVLGLGVMGCGIWILFDTGSLLNALSSAELRVVAAGLFMIGGVVALVSLTGCTGAALEKRFLLLVSMGFLIVLVLGQLFVTVLLLLDKKKIEQSVNDSVNRIISQYGNSSASRLMDNVQHFAECCGRTGPGDWLKNSFIQTLNLTSPEVLPCSCFRTFQPASASYWCSDNSSFTAAETWIGEGHGTFNESCSQKINDWLEENILTIVAMDAILILLQLAELSIAASLFRSLGQKEVRKKNKRLVDESDPDSSTDSNPAGGEQNHAFMDPDGADGGPTDPNYMPAEDANMAFDLYNQNQNLGYQGYQEAVQHY